MLQKLRKQSEGFTIIEVLIVLAIAGLILLIVFLAVPALQRNSRNTARNNDAARVSASVTECMSNRSGVNTTCGGTNVTDLNYGTLSQITSVDVAGTPGLTNATINFSFKCDAASKAKVAGTTRDFSVEYLLETSGGTLARCIGSQ